MEFIIKKLQDYRISMDNSVDTSQLTGVDAGVNMANVIGNAASMEHSMMIDSGYPVSAAAASAANEEVKNDDNGAEVQVTTRDLQRHVQSKKSLLYTLEVKGK